MTHDAFVSEQVGGPWRSATAGRSTETLRRTERTDEGDHRVISEEYAVLDRAGRLQLPRSHVEALELQHRVRLRLEEDHVGVWPDRPNAGGPNGAGNGSPDATGTEGGAPEPAETQRATEERR